MGNKPSSFVPDDVKRQAECQTPIYNFVNLSGGGELIELMKKATKDNNYEEVSLCIFFDISCVLDIYCGRPLLLPDSSSLQSVLSRHRLNAVFEDLTLSIVRYALQAWGDFLSAELTCQGK